MQGLSADETIEQQKLREEYLQAFRGGMRHHIEGMKIVDPEGQDVTPDKLKEIQKKKDCMADKDEFLFIPIEILKEIPYNMRCNKGKNLN